MKTKFVLASVFAALSGLGAFASTAKAGTDVSIRVNVGSPRPVVVVPSHGSNWRRDDCDDRGRPSPRGYWKEITVKRWVPARWVVTRDHCGREIRTFHRGHYAHHTDRVWVEYGRGRHGDYYARR